MTEDALLKALRTSSEVQALLKRDFDFYTIQTPDASSHLRVTKGTDYELIATDPSGGEFALCRHKTLTERPLLFASSEGQAGIIGRSLSEGLSIILKIPYWQDCLKFSGGGQLVEMRRVLPFLESDALAYMPHIGSSRQILRKRLALENSVDPVQTLYSAVTELSPSFPFFANDGSMFGSLFNRFGFTVESNAVWRRRLSGGI